MTPEQRQLAIDLRSLGHGYQAIADACEVSLTTAWRALQGTPGETSRAHDGRCRPKSSATRRRQSLAMLRRRGVWTPDALELLASRRSHSEVAKRLGIASSTVQYHRRKRLGL